MVDCKMCGHPYCEHAGTQRGIVIDCVNFTPKPQPQTNADRIRSMSDEELVELLKHGCCPYIEDECTMKGCEECISDWLKQPVKDGEDNA